LCSSRTTSCTCRRRSSSPRHGRFSSPNLPEQPQARHQSQAEKDDELVQRRTFRDYYIILRERLWIALPLALLISIGYGYKQMQAPRLYASTATMQFEKPDTIVTTVGVVDQSLRSEVDLNTNLQILQSGRMRARVLESFSAEDRRVLQRGALKRSPPGPWPRPWTRPRQRGVRLTAQQLPDQHHGHAR
jgi:hypothetical protein